MKKINGYTFKSWTELSLDEQLYVVEYCLDGEIKERHHDRTVIQIIDACSDEKALYDIKYKGKDIVKFFVYWK